MSGRETICRTIGNKYQNKKRHQRINQLVGAVAKKHSGFLIARCTSLLLFEQHRNAVLVNRLPVRIMLQHVH